MKQKKERKKERNCVKHKTVQDSLKWKFPFWDFPGGPVTKTVFPVQGPWIQSLVGELDHICWKLRVHMPLRQTLKIPSAATKTRHSQKNKKIFKRDFPFSLQLAFSLDIQAWLLYRSCPLDNCYPISKFLSLSLSLSFNDFVVTLYAFWVSLPPSF